MAIELFKRFVLSTLVFAGFSLHAASAQNHFAPRLEDCEMPAAAEPWRQPGQTSECRTLELIYASLLMIGPAQPLV